MIKRKDTLNERQAKMVREFFLNGGNKTAACRAAGYSCPEDYAAEAFANKKVVAAIEKEKERVNKKFELTRDWIVERLMRLADSGMQLAKFKKINDNGEPYWDFTGATEEELALLQNISSDIYMDGRGEGARAVKKLRVELVDPKGALDSLARIQGLFNDKLTIEGEVSFGEKLRQGRKRLAQAAVGEDAGGGDSHPTDSVCDTD